MRRCLLGIAARGARPLATAEQMFNAVPFALAAAPLLFAMEAPETREPRLLLAGVVVGIGLGAVRGSYLKFQLGGIYSRLRLPNGCDGLWAACLLAFCTLVAFSALSAPQHTLLHFLP